MSEKATLEQTAVEGLQTDLFVTSKAQPIIPVYEVWLQIYQRVLPICIRTNDDNEGAVQNAVEVANLSIIRIYGLPPYGA